MMMLLLRPPAAQRATGDQKQAALKDQQFSFLSLTQRELRPDSARGISRHITALSIQRVLDPSGGAESP